MQAGTHCHWFSSDLIVRQKTIQCCYGASTTKRDRTNIFQSLHEDQQEAKITNEGFHIRIKSCMP